MSPKTRLCRNLPLFLLLAALLFASLPAQAAPAHRPADLARKVTALGEDALSWVRNLAAGLWLRATAKEGTILDPDGQPAPSTSSDEGVTIDPNE
jgi:hypothetical protein